MATTTSTRSSPPESSASEVGRHDRLFYGGMATAMGLTVFTGFASTYYLRFFTGGPVATLPRSPGGRSPRSSTCIVRSSRPGCSSSSSRQLWSRVTA